MTLLATGLAKAAGEGPGQSITQKAKQLLAQILLPKTITPQAIEKYFRKALRTKAWYTLKPETKALILALRKWKHQIKSQTLTQTLKGILTHIELHTLKGKAIYYGIILTLKNTKTRLAELLKNTTQLLITGIFYLNNPPTLRIYG